MNTTEILLAEVQRLRNALHDQNTTITQTLAAAMGCYPHAPDENGKEDPSAPYVVDPSIAEDVAHHAAAMIREQRLTLAAEQMRQEGAPSNRWRWSVYHSAWVMPYAIEDLPAKYRYPWSDTCRDHDPICIVSRLGSEWRLRWRDMTKPTTVHQTARDAMQTAESR